MSKKSESQTGQVQSVTWHGTFRIFVEEPGSGWKLIGGTRNTIIHRKLLHLPEFSGKTVRAALANVKFDGRKIVAVNYLWIENWKISDDGNADEEDQFQLSVRRMMLGAKDDYIASAFAKNPEYIAIAVPTNEDVAAIKRCLDLSDEYSPLPPRDKISTRCFVDDPDVGWKHIGRKLLFDIYKGNVSVPKWAGKIYRSADAMVEIDGRKVVALCHLRISNWKIDEKGLTNPAELMKPTADYSVPFHPKPVHDPTSIPTPEDIVAIRRCLGLSGG